MTIYDDRTDQLLEGLAAAFDEMEASGEDFHASISAIRLANLCRMSWGGNKATADCIRKSLAPAFHP